MMERKRCQKHRAQRERNSQRLTVSQRPYHERDQGGGKKHKPQVDQQRYENKEEIRHGDGGSCARQMMKAAPFRGRSERRKLSRG
jgi:hypothetical protein